MKRIWDVLAGIIITAIALKWLFNMIAPYVPWLLVGLFVMLVMRRLATHIHRW